VRSKFVEERGQNGAVSADVLMYSALSLLKRDSSMGDLRNAMVKADTKLFCGGHVETIQTEFEKRGFQTNIAPITEEISVTVQPYGVDTNGNASGNVRPGDDVAFAVQLQNRDRVVARNVRVKLESVDRYLVPNTYLQGYGDLAAGQSVNIGNGWPLSAAVGATLDSRTPRGSQIRFRLKILIDNGPTQTVEGSIQL